MLNNSFNIHILMFSKLTDKHLAILGTVGSLVASYCLAPESLAWKAPLGVLAIAGSLLFAQGQWV